MLQVRQKNRRRRVCLGVVALALVAGCGDNINQGREDGGVGTDASAAQSAATIGGAVHASSAHYQLYGRTGGGDIASASASYQRVGAVTGSGR